MYALSLLQRVQRVDGGIGMIANVSELVKQETQIALSLPDSRLRARALSRRRKFQRMVSDRGMLADVLVLVTPQVRVALRLTDPFFCGVSVVAAAKSSAHGL